MLETVSLRTVFPLGIAKIISRGDDDPLLMQVNLSELVRKLSPLWNQVANLPTLRIDLVIGWPMLLALL